MDEPPLVKTAAQLFRRYCYKYRDSRTAGIICAGWDKRDGGQVIREVVISFQGKETGGVSTLLLFVCVCVCVCVCVRVYVCD